MSVAKAKDSFRKAAKEAGMQELANAVFKGWGADLDGQEHVLVQTLHAGIRTLGADTVIELAFGSDTSQWSGDIHDAAAVIRALEIHVKGGPTDELQRNDPVTAMLAVSMKMGN